MKISLDKEQVPLALTPYDRNITINTPKQQSFQLKETNQSDENNKMKEIKQKPYQQNEPQFKQSSAIVNDYQKQSQALQNSRPYLFSLNKKQFLPISHQKNMLELAKEQKNLLLINIEKLILEISYLENQIYDDSEVTYYEHPSYLVNECLEGMHQLKEQIDKNINDLQLVNGRLNIIQFCCGEESREIEKFKEFQQTQFEEQESYEFEFDGQECEFHEDDDYVYESINAFDQSPNNKFLVCCQYKTLSIWNICDHQIVNKIEYFRIISALTYCDNSDDFILGDKEGFIVKFDTSSKGQQPKQIFKVHQSTVCKIIIRDINSFYSSSTDNSIKLSDISNNNTLLVIQNNFSCFSGFDYSSKENFLISPKNNQEVVIYDSKNGEQITGVNISIQENEFINIQLSQNNNKALVNLFGQRKILLIDININLKLVQIQKQMNLEGQCYRLSWCLNDQAFAYLITGNFLVRYFGKMSFPLILKNYITQEQFQHQQPQINKFDFSLDHLIISLQNFIYIYQKENQDQI
ncbi:hypothetical protein pb186bvf_007078 [Paramecium bursaria]